jgi:hypothetical protein
VVAGDGTYDRGGAFQQARAGVVERLRARRDELVGVIFARVRDDAFGPVGAQDAEYVAGLRATVAAALEYVLAGIERGEEGAGQVPAVALEQARRAARLGVSLDTVLRRYVVGSALLGEFVMEEVDRGGRDGIPPTPPTPPAPPIQREALREALRVQASVLDRLLQAITIEYGDELARAGRSPEQRRAERVRRLLDGGAIEGSDLDYELGGWHLGVIAVGARAAQATRELAAGVNCRLLSVAQDEQSVWAWLGGIERSAFVALDLVISGAIFAEGPVSPSDAISAEGALPPPPPPPPPPGGVMLAIGEPARGLAGWRQTHRQAQAALTVALRRNGIPRNRTPPAQGVTFTRYADVALLAGVLKDEALAKALIDIYLSPLEDSRGSGPVLRETLRAYLAAERSVSSAAIALGVVRKTVESRLRTIEEKLGRTLHPCPAELEVALLLEDLSSAPQPPEISNIR